MNVRDVMTDEVACCRPTDNLFTVATRMRELNVGSLPIVEGNKLRGLITDRDIMMRAVAEKRPNSTEVREIMTEHIVSISPTATIDEAAITMAHHQVRRLPVVEDGELIGMIALGDLARQQLTDERAKQALVGISASH